MYPFDLLLQSFAQCFICVTCLFMTHYPEPEWEEELDPETETLKSLNDDLEGDDDEEFFDEDEPMMDDEEEEDDDEDEMDDIDEFEELERLERRIRKDEEPPIMDEDE